MPIDPRRPRPAPLSWRVRLAAVVLFAPLAAVVSPGAAVAATDLTIEGHGFGHGRGMSQYGAYGAALQGRTAGQILSYYYPQTTSATTSAPIKVWITKDDDGNTAVLAKNALRLTDYGNQTTVMLPRTGNPSATPIRAWRLTRVSDGTTRLSYLTDTWRSKRSMVGEGEFRSTDGYVTLRRPDGDTQYWGSIRHAAGRSVNIVSIDRYVRGVLPSEVFTSWPGAALRAQAVAARTYAAFKRAQRAGQSYHLCDSTSCQVYGGRAAEVTATNKAVADTAGRILTYQGKPALTEFSSSSGGWTVASSLPYQVAKVDKFDDFPQNPMHQWTKTIPGASISKAYPTIGTFTKLSVLTRDGNGDWGGRALSVRVTGTSGSVTVTAESFRSKLVLRSTWFRVIG